MSGDEVCDARFSKSCGGVSELFESAWSDEPHAYLPPVRDTSGEAVPELTNEAAANRWILSSPQSFCNVTDPQIIRRILPSVDRETVDSYRWSVTYRQSELSSLIASKSGINFGAIRALVPLKRGPSSRIVELRIEGSTTSLSVGKELEIRKYLSPSHLYSSAFVVEPGPDVDGVPESFTLKGAGWGHGVGLCQIGAGVMGELGHPAETILSHYFPGSQLTRIYS
jgi:SpoIID/LytB domain protein